MLDGRGAACLEAFASFGLVPNRLKDRATFFHHNKGSSFIDVTSTDRVTARRILKSSVLASATFSDHRYVAHTLAEPRRGGILPPPP